jgi:hypothetical protein
VAEFTYFGTTITNQCYIYKAVNSRLKSINFRYNSAQKLSLSHLVCKNIKTEMCKNMYNFTHCFIWICNMVSYVRKICRFRVFENGSNTFVEKMEREDWTHCVQHEVHYRPMSTW